MIHVDSMIKILEGLNVKYRKYESPFGIDIIFNTNTEDDVILTFNDINGKLISSAIYDKNGNLVAYN